MRNDIEALGLQIIYCTGELQNEVRAKIEFEKYLPDVSDYLQNIAVNSLLAAKALPKTSKAYTYISLACDRALQLCFDVSNGLKGKNSYCHDKYRGLSSKDEAVSFEGLKIDNGDGMSYIGRNELLSISNQLRRLESVPELFSAALREDIEDMRSLIDDVATPWRICAHEVPTEHSGSDAREAQNEIVTYMVRRDARLGETPTKINRTTKLTNAASDLEGVSLVGQVTVKGAFESLCARDFPQGGVSLAGATEEDGRVFLFVHVPLPPPIRHTTPTYSQEPLIMIKGDGLKKVLEMVKESDKASLEGDFEEV